MTDRAAFGLELRRARERRGLSLDEIAEQTKVSASHFAGLERGDLSRWPSGIFRRAFVRSYADAVGIDADETVSRFVRLFPDPHAEDEAVGTVKPCAPPSVEANDSAAPRLVLADERRDRQSLVLDGLRRVAAGLVDLALAAVPAALVAPFLGWQHFWLVAACVGAAGHMAVLASTGSTPGSWLLLTRRPVAAPPSDSTLAPHRRADVDVVNPVPARRHQPRHAASGLRPATPVRSHRVSH